MEQSSGRGRLSIHGAINLEIGQTIMKDVLTVDALTQLRRFKPGFQNLRGKLVVPDASRSRNRL